MIIDGVLGSSALDSSGEILDIEGADISDVDKGTLLLNYEHQPGELGADTIVGKVIAAKKIYSEADCETDRQRKYWRDVKLPFIYGICRLFDGAGHKNAQAIAAIIRDNAANNEPLVCRFSVEGSTLDKKDNVLLSSVIRRCAVTVRPCNRTANSGLIEDPNAPAGFEKKHVKEKTADLLDFESTTKFEHPVYTRLGGSVEIECNPLVDNLEKAITAGQMGGAPSTLTGGAALQREDLGVGSSLRAKAVKAIQGYEAKKFTKEEFRQYIKHQLPEASDDFLDHFTTVAEDYHVRRKLAKDEAPVPAQLPAQPPPVDPRAALHRLQSLSVDLNHALSQFVQPDTKAVDLHAVTPEVHTIDVKVGDRMHPAGRVLVHNGQIRHLEDYHGLLSRALPAGPMDEQAASRMYAMASNPYLTVRRDAPLFEENPANGTEAVEVAPEAPAPAQRPPSVWHYQRAGMDKPHTLEVKNGSYLLDGNPLDPSEVQTVLNNVRSGAGTLRYITTGATGSAAAQRVKKMEAQIIDLMKSIPPEDRSALHEALTAARDLVARGQMDPKHERTLTRFLYEDRMTPGIGNKDASLEFLGKKKPGVYVQMDGNDFREINNNHGHAAGDAAIQTFGKYAREAMDEAVGRQSGKLFRTPDDQDLYRNGGDEFMAYVPSHEHAAKFARALSQKLEAHPPIGGTHKLSMSFGFGLDPHSADSALYEAKKQKFHPNSDARKVPVGQTSSLAHSHVPGYEGPVPVSDPGAAAVHHVMSDPKVSQPKMSSPEKAPSAGA